MSELILRGFDAVGWMTVFLGVIPA